eukprot:SAG11_NODE_22708_length_401_cov_1.066225_1_plen_36_part_01
MVAVYPDRGFVADPPRESRARAASRTARFQSRVQVS